MSTMRKKMVMVFDANRIISEDSEGFVIPHGDHNHYIKVQTKGYEAALKNKIPSLQSNYQPGTFEELLMRRQSWQK